MAMIFVKIPKGCLKAQLGNVSAATLAKINAWLTSRGKPTIAVGDDNPLFTKLLEYGLEGVEWKIPNGPATTLATSGPYYEEDFWSEAEVKFLVDLEGDVTGWPCWFPIPAANLNDPVPAEFPNRTWVGATDPENPVVVDHTWTTWYDGMPGHDPVELPAGSGTYYCSAADTWNQGRPIDASVWRAAGLNPITASEYIALQPTE